MAFVLDDKTTALPEGIQTVRLLFCDAAGIRRARAVPLGGIGANNATADADARAKRIAALLSDGVGLTKACMGMPAHADMVAPESGLTPVGEVRLVPGRRAAQAADDGEEAAAARASADALGSAGPPSALLHRLPWCPSHAVAVADMLDADNTPGAAWACCPRAALRRVAAAARRDLGLAFVVGFELEFVLLRPAGAAAGAEAAAGAAVCATGATIATAAHPPPFCALGPALEAFRAADDLPYASSAGLDAHAALLDEMVDACASLGQPVLQYHAESAPGQYELALAACGDPVAAADGLLLAKEAVAAVAARRGYLACFAPKPFPAAAGSGMHAHVSIVDAKTGANVMGGRGGGGGGSGSGAEGEGEEVGAGAGITSMTGGLLSPRGESFVAGLLAHLPALLPFTAPSAGSYERLRPGCWAGAFAAYGVENREAPLRITAARGVAAAATAASGRGTGAGGGGGGSGSSSNSALARNVNVEVKAVDGSANPHAALAALLTAGLLGLRERAALPGPPLERDPGAEAAQQQQQPTAPPPLLPATLPEALAALEADEALISALHCPRTSLGAPLFDALIGVRRCEARLGVTAAQTALRY